jgi:hypothetical protein
LDPTPFLLGVLSKDRNQTSTDVRDAAGVDLLMSNE